MKLAQMIPARIRQVIYTVLGVAFAVEAIWDFVPAGVESRVVATLAALGFGVAVSNTPNP